MGSTGNVNTLRHPSFCFETSVRAAPQIEIKGLRPLFVRSAILHKLNTNKYHTLQ